jgi:chemotaxis protein MotB
VVRRRSVRFAARCRVGVLLGAGLVLSGCVGIGTHQRVLDQYAALGAENRALEKKVEYLSAANQSLDEELIRRGEETEDLRQAQQQLEQRATELSSSETALTAKLTVLKRETERRNAELAAQAARSAELGSAYEGLVSDLESQLAAGQIEIAQLREGLRVNVAQDILFPSGSARLNAEGRDVLVSVAKRLAELPYRIDVEGHTDNAGIRGKLTERYPSNWELAAARASSVVRLFLGVGIDGTRLTAVSNGEYRPVAPNDTPEGRALNRRIEIRLLPDASARAGDLQKVTADGLASSPEGGADGSSE